MEDTPLELSLLANAADLYQTSLGGSRPAQDCLKALGLTDPDTLQRFRVGWCFGQVLRKWADTEDKLRQLQRLRLLNRRGQEALQGCLTIPLGNADQLSGLYGWRLRSYTPATRDRFVPGMASGICQSGPLQADKPVLLVECQGSDEMIH